MSDTAWKLLANGAAIAAAVVARKALTSGWEAATGTEPPENPADPSTDWREALAWGLLTGAVIGVARMLASREAARVAQRMTGSLPDDAVRSPA
jgi:hypothetical protein